MITFPHLVFFKPPTKQCIDFFPMTICFLCAIILSVAEIFQTKKNNEAVLWTIGWKYVSACTPEKHFSASYLMNNLVETDCCFPLVTLPLSAQ